MEALAIIPSPIRETTLSAFGRARLLPSRFFCGERPCRTLALPLLEQLSQQVFPALLFAGRVEQGAEPRTAVTQSIVKLTVRFRSPQEVGQRLSVPDGEVAGVIFSQKADRAGDVR